MPSIKNKEALKSLVHSMEENPNFLFANYTKLKVSDMSALRRSLSGVGAKMKVVKNNLLSLAVAESMVSRGVPESEVAEMRSNLFGPTVVVFFPEDYPRAAKLLVKFAKDAAKDAAKEFKEVPKGTEAILNVKFTLRSGVIENNVLDADAINALADLPTREEVLVIIARGLNSSTEKIARGMNEIMASLARGVQKVAEKNSEK